MTTKFTPSRVSLPPIPPRSVSISEQPKAEPVTRTEHLALMALCMATLGAILYFSNR